MKKYNYSPIVYITRLFFIGAVLGLIITCWHTTSMADRHKYKGIFQHNEVSEKVEKNIKEKTFFLQSLKKQENLLILNGETFVFNDRLRVKDVNGERIRLKDLSIGTRIGIQYSYGLTDSDSHNGPKENILMKIWVIKKSAKRK